MYQPVTDSDLIMRHCCSCLKNGQYFNYQMRQAKTPVVNNLLMTTASIIP